MRLLRLWFVAFCGFFLLIGAWSLASPYDASFDERQHILRAAGVARGEFAPPPAAAHNSTGAYHTVPAALIDENCWANRPVTPTCTRPPDGDGTLVRVGTPAGRYHPAYYAVVGLPLVIWPSMKGVMLARLIGGALSAALLAAALVSVVRFSRHRLMFGAMLLAVTPTAIQMASEINPNGVEIAAGVAFFAAAIPIFLGSAGSRAPAWLIGVAAVGAVVLVSVRSGGPVWLAFGVLALLLPTRWPEIRALWRRHAVRWAGLAVVLAGLTAAAWIVIMRASQLGPVPGVQLSLGQRILFELGRWPALVDEFVADLAWGDARLPAIAYPLWQFPVAALLVWALLYGGKVGAWRILMLTIGPALFAAGFEVKNANTYGFVLQGRYLLPILAGGLLVGAWIVEERALPGDRCRQLNRALLTLVLPIHLIALIVTMARYQSATGTKPYPGISSYDPLAGVWHPEFGSALPLALAGLGLTVLGVLGWLLTRVPEPTTAAGPAAGTCAAAGADTDSSTSAAKVSTGATAR